ncbi:MAG: class I SAM-dependent methyltransferase [Cyanobacteria bacterium HKST-UBA01]|nr:class I SAM-dependent methyltransferase [Cyanobacteria bacterium HKST-UBA01]
MKIEDQNLTEHEIRPDDLMVKQKELYALDVEDLMKGKADFDFVSCPACDGNDASPRFEKYQMNFVRCSSCKTIYANPRPNPSQLTDYYSNSRNYEFWNKEIFPRSEKVRREKIFKPRVELIRDLCKKHSIKTDLLVEIGSGFGTFLEELLKTQLFKRAVAVEPTPSLANSCREKNLQVVEKFVENTKKDDFLERENAIDVIVNFEVIEHLYDPRAFLEQCSNLMDCGSLLVLTCPNGNGFDIELLGAISGAVDTEHINLFNPDSLSLLFEKTGFEVIERMTPGRLDAELVRKAALDGSIALDSQPFLKKVLLEDWNKLGPEFQNFLSANGLSSNMMIAGIKK